VALGCLGFLQGVHVACVNGTLVSSAPFQIALGLVYIFTAVFLLRGVMLRKGMLIMAWILFSILRLLGEVFYLIFAHIVYYGTVKVWPPNFPPEKKTYEDANEFYHAGPYRRYERMLAAQEVDGRNYAAQKVTDLETILVHSFIIAMQLYFIVSVYMYRRRLGTEKAEGRVPVRQAELTV